MREPRRGLTAAAVSDQIAGHHKEALMGFGGASEEDDAQTIDVLTRHLASRRPDIEGLAIDGFESPSATGFSSETRLFDLVGSRDGAPVRDHLVLRYAPRG